MPVPRCGSRKPCGLARPSIVRRTASCRRNRADRSARARRTILQRFHRRGPGQSALSRNVPVKFALRADAQQPLGFLRKIVCWHRAALPKSFGNATLGVWRSLPGIACRIARCHRPTHAALALPVGILGDAASGGQNRLHNPALDAQITHFDYSYASIRLDANSILSHRGAGTPFFPSYGNTAKWWGEP